MSARRAPKRPDPAAPDFRLDSSPFYWLTRAYGGYQLAMGKALKHLGIDAPDWRILLVAADYEPMSVSKLAECLAVPSSTMVKAVQRMEAAGLLSTAASESDRRVTQVRLTDTGRASLARVREVAARVFKRSLDGFDDAELSRMVGDLTRLAYALEDRPG